ncbi:Uaf30p [Saccharomyces paradoxus]|uniref:Uaf30p n=1 Tax=Saccharomyces paradoxus TaxID=27291 RepID=A0A8B8V067_SACPA|nr:Uaf30 [Saccharomyces paradoxus]QHS76378.1 Uaf30 [Saccharomyces paradoxus]
MAELNDYGTMIDIVLSDMDLTTVTTKKVRRALKEVYAIDVESQGKAINKLIRKHLDLVIERPRFERSLQDLLRENTTLAMKLSKEMIVNKRSSEEEKKNDDETKGTHIKRKKGAASKSPISTRKVILSKSLAGLLGDNQLTRTEVVRRIWAYIKEHGLQNPNNKKEILCDEKLELILGKSTDMFEMHKTLASHMTDPNKTSDPLPLIQELHKKEKLSISDSEKSDAKGI